MDDTTTAPEEDLLIALGIALASYFSHYTGLTFEESTTHFVEVDPQAESITAMVQVLVALREEEPEADLVDLVHAVSEARALSMARTYLFLSTLNENAPADTFDRLNEVRRVLAEAGVEDS